MRTLHGYARAIFALAWSPDGQGLASGDNEMTVLIWNLATRQGAQMLRGHHQHINAVAWNRATNRIASGSADHMMRVWDAQTGACTHLLQGHSKSMSSVEWSPDGSGWRAGVLMALSCSGMYRKAPAGSGWNRVL